MRFHNVHMDYHVVTLADIDAHRSELEEMAEDERYIDGSRDFDDFVNEVEAICGSPHKWDLGTDTDSPVIKELRKITRRVWKEMREL